MRMVPSFSVRWTWCIKLDGLIVHSNIFKSLGPCNLLEYWKPFDVQKIELFDRSFLLVSLPRLALRLNMGQQIARQHNEYALACFLIVSSRPWVWKNWSPGASLSMGQLIDSEYEWSSTPNSNVLSIVSCLFLRSIEYGILSTERSFPGEVHLTIALLATLREDRFHVRRLSRFP